MPVKRANVGFLMEVFMQKFQASYEDAAKSEQAAVANGWNKENGGMIDFLNGSPPHTRRIFTTQPEAEAWLLAEIKDDKTLFGCGDIDVYQQPKRRCKYCTCDGWVRVQSFLADNDGITEERDIPEDCAN